MSAKIEQIKAMLERAGKTNLLQKQKVDLNKERLQLEATVNKEKIDKSPEEAADGAAIKAFPENKSYSTVVDRVVDYGAIDRKNYRDGFIAGAEWKAKQDNRDEIFHDGMRYAYDQLMKEAVEAVVTTNLANRPIIYLDQLQGFQYGDKVKLIVIKED